MEKIDYSTKNIPIPSKDEYEWNTMLETVTEFTNIVKEMTIFEEDLR